MANVHRMTKKRLGELLLQEDVVSEEQLKHALEEQENTGELIGEILVRKGFVTEGDIARTISTQFSFPYLSVMHYYISPDMTQIFPLEMLEKYLFVPIDRFGEVLTVVVAGLLDQKVVDEIEAKTKCTTQVYVGMVSEVKQVIKEKFAASAAQKAGPKGAARQAAATQDRMSLMVDVTAPPKRDVSPVASDDGDQIGETIDLADAIKAADDSGNGSDDAEEKDEETDRGSKRFRFFEAGDDEEEQ